ncbi:MAG TPA: N(2)-fixation sustaining protein CowN [Azonexus sp.]
METTAPAAACSCRPKTDRYVSFDGIDCAGNARRLMESIECNLPAADPERAFWQYFMAKRQPRSGPAPDDLFLVHSHINQIRELFEACGDEAALALLLQVEEECC